MRVLAAILLVCLAGAAQAAVWHVEKDGSGDFTVIQDAINASAVGDTVRLGPGRYTEYAPFSTSGWTEDTYAAVTVDSLTLVGVDHDGVIIGPEVPAIQGVGPKGIATSESLTHFRLQALTVENVRDGAHLLGRGEVSDCRFRACETGVAGFTVWGLTMRDCEFLENEFSGVVAVTGAGGVLIENCQFVDNFSVGATIARTAQVTVQNCTFEGSRGGLQLSENTVGEVIGCTFARHNNGGIILVDQVDGTVQGCTIGTMPYNIWVAGGSTLRGHGNVLKGGRVATLRFWFNSTASGFQNNDILKGEGPSVHAEGYVTDPIDIDLTDNYWGTTSADSIAAWILDGHDLHVPVIDPNLSNVLFEPFLPKSIPTRVRSMSSFKSLFSGGN